MGEQKCWHSGSMFKIKSVKTIQTWGFLLTTAVFLEFCETDTSRCRTGNDLLLCTRLCDRFIKSQSWLMKLSQRLKNISDRISLSCHTICQVGTVSVWCEVTTDVRSSLLNRLLRGRASSIYSLCSSAHYFKSNPIVEKKWLRHARWTMKAALYSLAFGDAFHHVLYRRINRTEVLLIVFQVKFSRLPLQWGSAEQEPTPGSTFQKHQFAHVTRVLRVGSRFSDVEQRGQNGVRGRYGKTLRVLLKNTRQDSQVFLQCGSLKSDW